jgi:nitroimidazol reductase NimA-like FMN-containing flavoprotein (pyridoxamine 5'-phosphate oxidase superfamily)
MDQEFVPPLPASITDILQTTNLCYLATSEDHAPHLSLMNFSYINDEEYGRHRLP